MLPKTFLPDRNQKPNQLQSKTDEQKVGALGAAAGRGQPAERAPGAGPGAERRQPQEAAEEAVRPLGLADLAAAGWSSTSCCPCWSWSRIYWAIRGAKAWRRRRHATRGTATARVAWAWDDLMNSAKSLRPHRAPPGHPARAGGRPAPACPSANALAGQANALIFGPGTPEVADAEAYWKSTNEARGDLRANCDFWRRLRSDVDPRPLFARGPETPARGRRTLPSFATLTRRTAAS